VKALADEREQAQEIEEADPRVYKDHLAGKCLLIFYILEKPID
jgi:hypothetical protein